MQMKLLDRIQLSGKYQFMFGYPYHQIGIDRQHIIPSAARGAQPASGGRQGGAARPADDGGREGRGAPLGEGGRERRRWRQGFEVSNSNSKSLSLNTYFQTQPNFDATVSISFYLIIRARAFE